jgi:hypothetical protein
MAINLQIENTLSATPQPVKDQNGNTSPLALSTNAVGVGGIGRIGQINIDDANGKNTIAIGGSQGAGRIGLGGDGSRGQVAIFDENTNFTINLGGVEGSARIGLGGNGSIGIIDVFDAQTNHAIRIGSAQDPGSIRLGGNGSIGTLDVFDAQNHFTIRIGGASGPGRIGLGGNGSAGVIDLFDANTNQTIKIDGKTGDVQLLGADCAEDFDVEGPALEPGTVMVIGDEDKLHQCTEAYDKKVAGVIAGAGGCRPGIVLGKKPSPNKRLPLALTGKVYCKADAQYCPIQVGDLLTTSPTPGFSMKAEDPLKAFGTVIGKALCSLPEGQGLIPILIALQ